MTKLLNSIVLAEGISHLEDLSADEFISTVETLADKIVTEKLDGANLWFGVDAKGLFTSREGKSPKKGRFYSAEDYPLVANYNGFRAAHLALEKIEPIATKILKPDDVIEVEILFGRQPNTITYGHNDLNYIVVLRGVNDTPEERINALIKALENKTVKVESTVISSSDGENIENTDEVLNWQFTKVKPIPSVKIDLKEVNALLKQFKGFLAAKNSVDASSSNKDILEISLGSVPKDKRDAIKAERERLSAEVSASFKNPIKDLLLAKLVRKVKPILQSKDLHPSEDLGVEGVVLRDPVTGSQTKIVDKDIFTAINTFNSAVRNNVSGLVRTTNQDTSIDMRGGIFGQAKIRIADLMGAKELAMSSGVKRFITKFKKETVQATAAELAKNLNINSVNSYKTKISAVLKNAISEINSQLEEFKADNSKFKLQLKTGKDIQLTPDIIKKTLTAIAETKQEIRKIDIAVQNAQNPTDLVMALYGKTIQSLFEVSESVTTYNFIKSFEEADAGVTSASAAAPVETRLMGNRMIVSRPRKFKKVQKFAPKLSLVKAVNEAWQHVDDMKFAADADDKAEVVIDPEFNTAKNNLMTGDVTNSSVTQYLNKASEMNDTVDAVAFGLEMDDGQIAKVFINAAQADEFEKKLAELLGKEDNIENVINVAAETFDIIDVEYPEGYGPSEESTDETPEQAVPTDEITDETTSDAAADEDFEMEPDHDSTEETEEDTGEENTAEDGEETTNAEEDPDEENKDDTVPKKKPKKKAKTDMEESMSSFSEQFRTRLLESRKKKEEPKEEVADEKIEKIQQDKISDKFLAAFPTKQEKAIITLMVNLGVTQKVLTPFKSELRQAIEPTADLYVKDSMFRTFIKKYIVAVSAKSSTNEDLDLADNQILESSEDEFLNRLSNSYQVVIYSILRELGISDKMVKLGQRSLLAGIRKYGALAQQNNDIRLFLFTIADHLGVDHRGILAVKKTQDQGEQDTIKTGLPGTPVTLPIKESIDAQAVVVQLLASLGLNTDSTRSVASELKLLARSPKMRHLATNQNMLNKVAALTALLQKNAPAESVNESHAGPFDYGSWTVGKLGSAGIFISNDAMTLKFTPSETDKLEYILKHHKKGAVRTQNGKDYVIMHHKHGDFGVKEIGNDEAVEVKLSKLDTQNIMNFLLEE